MSAIASARSIPVQKARSPAPVTSTQRTSSSSRRAAQSERSSDRMVELKEFIASGRLRVTSATPASMVTIRVSKVSMHPNLGCQASNAAMARMTAPPTDARAVPHLLSSCSVVASSRTWRPRSLSAAMVAPMSASRAITERSCVTRLKAPFESRKSVSGCRAT